MVLQTKHKTFQNAAYTRAPRLQATTTVHALTTTVRPLYHSRAGCKLPPPQSHGFGARFGEEDGFGGREDGRRRRAHDLQRRRAHDLQRLGHGHLQRRAHDLQRRRAHGFAPEEGTRPEEMV
jgi:hypothetical protein